MERWKQCLAALCAAKINRMTKMKPLLSPLLSSPLLFIALLLPPLLPLAQAGPQLGASQRVRQDPALIRQAAEQFLQVQTAGLPGQVSLNIGAIDPRLTLAACSNPQAFLPTGSRLWGKTTVGVRCLAPTPWTIYLQTNISVIGEYIASAVKLLQGQLIGSEQVVKMTGELTTLPAGIVTNLDQALGRTLSMSLPAGAPLRLDGLRSPNVVQQGQIVRVTSNGPGFSVSAEARAIGNATEGQIVQVKTAAGQQISGVAKAGGLVEVPF
jgi:flagella basal body P-ring formation protein FlgA